MSVSILTNKGCTKAMLYDNTTDWAIDAPVASGCEVCGIDAEEMLMEFLSYMEDVRDCRDIRRLSPPTFYTEWRNFMDRHDKHECPDCEVTGTIMQDDREITCGSCGGSGYYGVPAGEVRFFGTEDERAVR